MRVFPPVRHIGLSSTALINMNSGDRCAAESLRAAPLRLQQVRRPWPRIVSAGAPPPPPPLSCAAPLGHANPERSSAAGFRRQAQTFLEQAPY